MDRPTTSVAAGLAAGVAAGALAQAASARYGEERSRALRATAHAGLPFLVGALVTDDHQPPPALTWWRAGFIGVHLTHLRLIVRLLRDGGGRDPLVRAALVAGSPNYALVIAQTALTSPSVARSVGDQRAARWHGLIDAQLLRAYVVATSVGLARHRRPLPVYLGLAALLATGISAQRRSATQPQGAR